MATLIINATPAEGQDEALGRYQQAVLPILMAAGGKPPPRRLRVTNTIAGDGGTSTVIMMDFDSAQAVVDAFASDEYQAMVPERDKAFSNIEILIAEDLG